MLKIYDTSNSSIRYPMHLPGDNWYINHKYDGKDKLSFEISSSEAVYQHIAEEVKIEAAGCRYIVKEIDDHSDSIQVDCEIDLDEWKSAFWREYRRTDILLSEVLAEIKPVGWSVSGAATFTKHTTIEASEGNPLENVVALDILEKACEVYGCTVNYDVINKILRIIDVETYTDTGQYFTDELNLRSIGFNGSSSDFATRLYAYGKKGDDGKPLTFASINNGMEYVEDHTYSSKVITAGWSDERYTQKSSLLAAAKEKLKTLAFPQRSYECDVINLDNDIWMYKKVWLIDRRRKIRVSHRVIEYKEYPDCHRLDVVTLSTATPKIETSIKQIKAQMEDQKAESRNFMLNAISIATALITGAQGGNVVINQDADGFPSELLIMDTKDINTAKNVWRWNIGGFGYSSNGYNGPYKTAITMDGGIVADFINTGSLSAALIKAGTMLLDRLYGGTLTIGGDGNNRGRIELRNAQDKTVVECNNGGILINGGELRNINGKKGVLIAVGNLSFLYDGKRVFGMYSSIDADEVGGNLVVDKDYLKIYVSNGSTMTEVLLINNGLNPNGYEEKVIFRNSVRFTQRPVFGGGISFGDCTISQTNNNQMVFAYNGTGVFTAGYNTFTVQSLPGGVANCWNNLDLHGKSLLNSSDERLKDNIKPCSKMALDTVNNINLYEFDWLTDGSHEDIGYVAQQVEEVEPDLAYIDQEGSYSVKESKMIRYLWKAVQELSEEVGILKKQLSESHDFDRYTREEKQKYTAEYMNRNGGTENADN